jgi:hypothetical protein
METLYKVTATENLFSFGILMTKFSANARSLWKGVEESHHRPKPPNVSFKNNAHYEQNC